MALKGQTEAANTKALKMFENVAAEFFEHVYVQAHCAEK